MKSLNLLQEIERLNRFEKAKLLSPFRRDPYHTKNRRFPRGGVLSRSLRRIELNASTRKVVNAQQEIEKRLRDNGVKWRSVEKLVHSEYEGDWGKGLLPIAKTFLTGLTA